MKFKTKPIVKLTTSRSMIIKHFIDSLDWDKKYNHRELEKHYEKYINKFRKQKKKVD